MPTPATTAGSTPGAWGRQRPSDVATYVYADRLYVAAAFERRWVPVLPGRHAQALALFDNRAVEMAQATGIKQDFATRRSQATLRRLDLLVQRGVVKTRTAADGEEAVQRAA